MAQSRHERRIAQRQEREDVNKKSRTIYDRRQRNKKFLNIAIIFAVGILALWGITRILAPEQAGEHDELAQCLTDRGVVMYGTDWCPHCQEQKQLFGASFKLVMYVNCDANPSACDAAGVEGYPTWVFPIGDSLSGAQPLQTLAARAGCGLAAQS